MTPEFRRGADPIREALKASGGSGGNFVPELRWREDKEEKFILILHPLEDTYTVDLHEWVEVGEGEKANGEKYKRYESFISRKDRAIGEDYDDLSDRLELDPKRRVIGCAVELEPVWESVKGRKRPKNFQIKTETVTNSEGEEFIRPQVGLLIYSASNFWGWLTSFNDTQAPINETPMQVIRRGKGTDTSYDFMHYNNLDVDFSGLFDNLTGIRYLSDDLDEVISDMENTENDYETAAVIGNALLAKRIAELADGDRYKEFIDPIKEYTPRFPNQKRKRNAPSGSGNGAEAPAAPSSPTEEDRMKRFSNLRSAVEASAKS